MFDGNQFELIKIYKARCMSIDFTFHENYFLFLTIPLLQFTSSFQYFIFTRISSNLIFNDILP